MPTQPRHLSLSAFFITALIALLGAGPASAAPKDETGKPVQFLENEKNEVGFPGPRSPEDGQILQ